MNDELEQLLKNLQLKTIAEILETSSTHGREEGAHLRGVPGRLLRAEWHHRQENALTWRIKRAGCPSTGPSRPFPSSASPASPAPDPQLRRTRLRRPGREHRLHRPHRRRQDRDWPAAFSSRRSRTATAACSSRPRTSSTRCTPRSPTAPRASSLNRLARIDVLLIDEMGYLNLRPEQTNIFFKLMEERYRRKATIITTNLDYEEWHGFLGNKALVDGAAQPAAPPLPHRHASTAPRCANPPRRPRRHAPDQRRWPEIAAAAQARSPARRMPTRWPPCRVRHAH